MSLSDHVVNRLYNGKFSSARERLRMAPDESTPFERDVIDALASVYGNTGWLLGDAGVIVGAALTGLGLRCAEDEVAR